LVNIENVSTVSNVASFGGGVDNAFPKVFAPKIVLCAYIHRLIKVLKWSQPAKFDFENTTIDSMSFFRKVDNM
jgi:hypothetical protein